MDQLLSCDGRWTRSRNSSSFCHLSVIWNCIAKPSSKCKSQENVFKLSISNGSVMLCSSSGIIHFALSFFGWTSVSRLFVMDNIASKTLKSSTHFSFPFFVIVSIDSASSFFSVPHLSFCIQLRLLRCFLPCQYFHF